MQQIILYLMILSYFIVLIMNIIDLRRANRIIKNVDNDLIDIKKDILLLNDNYFNIKTQIYSLSKDINSINARLENATVFNNDVR